MVNKFRFSQTPIEGLVVVEPTVFGDNRGFFMESYSHREFAAAGITAQFVQDNHSCSSKGVLRGLHFQSRNAQGKLIRVTSGRILDVAVDLRSESPTFGQWFSIVLSAGNGKQLYIPPRFAHGLLAIEDDSHVLYKCTDYYAPGYDGGVLWSDPGIGIDWELEKFGLDADRLIISDKDKLLPGLAGLDPDTLFG